MVDLCNPGIRVVTQYKFIVTCEVVFPHMNRKFPPYKIVEPLGKGTT